jgi:cyanobactin maturation PatA/PatG family protease
VKVDPNITAGGTCGIAEIDGLNGLWAETLGDPRIRIAILDGPVDTSHSSFAGASFTRLETVVSGVVDQGPASQHGTHVASVIFGQHGGPLKGVAPHCHGLIVPIFGDGADGSIIPCSQLDLARAIKQAVREGAHIINISGGELSPSGTAHPLLADAVQYCVDSNVLIVAAVGNEGCECLHVPGALSSVLAVGAMNAEGLPLDSSNWGDVYRVQGVLAPGEKITGAKPGGGLVARSGTSYATPIVSGVAALLLCLQLKLGKEPNPQGVRAAILDSAYSCDPQAVLDCRPFLVGGLNLAGARRLCVEGPGEAKGSQRAAENRAMQMMGGSVSVEPRETTTLKVGAVAPDFSAVDHTGRDVHLHDYRGRTVVLWFFPRVDTPG